MTDAASCALCAGGISEVPLPPDWPGVTSDNRAWKTPGPVAVCPRCGYVQKACTAAWRDDVARVYADYSLYHLSAGVEQVLFSAGVIETKSARMLDRFAVDRDLTASGTLLDIGCGQGSLLRAFATRHPGWRLHGHEQDDRARATILAQPGVEGFHTGPIARLGQRFDLVTIVHVFEHVFEPVRLLEEVRETLAPGGALLIQVPDAEQNPFDLMVVDHRSHFSSGHLVDLARAAGYNVEVAASGWIAKEITIVLTLAADTVRAPRGPIPEPSAGCRVVTQSVAWLEGIVALAAQLGTTPGGFGIFGTSNAATWLAGVPGVECQFFVDEDPNRIGKMHLGRLIVAPTDVPPGAAVLLAFPSAQADAVRSRLEARVPGSTWRVPPAADQDVA